MPYAPIPLLCDRCRAEGLGGEDPFARFAELLDFEPVPRLKPRADGWSADVQRAFIALLACTGSIRQAARAVGRAAFGVDQLLKAPGSEGFRAALEAAHAAAEEKTRLRLRSAVDAAARAEASWSPAPEPWSHAATRACPEQGRRAPGRSPSAPTPDPEAEVDDMSPEAMAAVLEPIFGKYLVKLRQEREARLEGQVVAADFYLRQITWLEVMMDVGSGDGFRLLHSFRVDGRDTIDIAETPMSWLLGRMRRREWAHLGEPARPEHPPRRYLVDHGRYSTEPLEAIRGGPGPSHEEQRRAFEERHAEDARAQVEWEAQARRDYERRRDSAADS